MMKLVRVTHIRAYRIYHLSLDRCTLSTHQKMSSLSHAYYYASPVTTYDHQSPILHILAIFLLILAALGFASTLLTLPFGILPSAPASATFSMSGGRRIMVPSGVPNLKQGTWMTFFLVLCLALVLLQGPQVGSTRCHSHSPGQGTYKWTRAGGKIVPRWSDLQDLTGHSCPCSWEV